MTKYVVESFFLSKTQKVFTMKNPDITPTKLRTKTSYTLQATIICPRKSLIVLIYQKDANEGCQQGH